MAKAKDRLALPRRCKDCGTYEPIAALGHPTLGYRMVRVEEAGGHFPYYFEPVPDLRVSVCEDWKECMRRQRMGMFEARR